MLNFSIARKVINYAYLSMYLLYNGDSISLEHISCNGTKGCSSFQHRCSYFICGCSFKMIQHDICFLNETVRTMKHVADLYGHPSFCLNLDSYKTFLCGIESYI